MWRNYLKEHQIQVEAWMQSLVPAQPGPLAQVMESMRYSLFAGGKRLRPILLMAAADAVGESREEVAFALASRRNTAISLAGKA